MIANFVKVIFRYLFRSRFFTLLNIAGLSIGMACCIIIFLFINNEFSYDKFHLQGDNIYRVVRESQINGMPYDIGVTSGPFAPALMQDYDGKIHSVVRILPYDGLLVRFGDKTFLEDKNILADPNFFEFFSYPLLQGDPKTALQNPNSLVISKAFALKYFGTEDALGKVVNVDMQNDLTITGVLGDLPGNSHLQFETIGSLLSLEHEDHFAGWWNNYLFTYVRVDNPLDVNYLNGHFPQFMDKYFRDDFNRVGNRIGLKLEPLRDIYFNYQTRYETNVAHGNMLYIYVFGSLGILLILLASINYINLATAQSVERAKEVGIRKTLGCSQKSIAAQFLSESFVLCFIAMVTALIIIQVVTPVFNSSLNINIPDVDSVPQVWLFLCGLLVIISFLSGGYPAFMLSSFRPVRVLKGEIKGNFQYFMLRKALVTFQFGISAMMIMATFFISRQLQYMNEKDLGFNADQVIQIQVNNQLMIEKAQSFSNRLLADKNIISASYASGHPGGFYDASTVRVEGVEQNLRMRTLYTDENFLETLDIHLTAGRFFSKEFPGDSTRSTILNETAVRQLGWSPEEAIGKRVMLSQFDSAYKEVIGVIDDYHFTSLKEVIEPLIISYRQGSRNLFVKVSGTNVREAVAGIEQIWNSYQSGFPIETNFLDEVIGKLYADEMNQGKMFRIFSAISVMIACFGILGLSTYIAVQRKKEIGVRKVMGASIGQLSFLLTKDLLQLVLLANIFAIPVAYVVLDMWSQSFAYRAPLNPLLFLLAGALVTAIAAVIVSINAVRAAGEDPVNSLRPE